MPKMIFVNLPVKDLAAATRFYAAIGCTQNPQFSDDNASCMVWSDTITFMLLTERFFASFTPKPVADGRKTSEVLIALSFDDREAVDAFATAAAEAGGTADFRAPVETDWMYQRAIEDLDGHVFEAVWMNLMAAAAEPAGQPATQPAVQPA